MTREQIAIADLDEVLAADMSGDRVRGLQKTLVDAAEHCRSKLDHGVTPDEARRMNALMAACSAGLGLLPALWHIQQERKSS